ncbi:MAG: hypothetical protein OER04_11385, partial [Cyclobacteriaceae bacterium]|nr:hypothetical protein [Cyclobacteriaceae bacterium]
MKTSTRLIAIAVLIAFSFQPVIAQKKQVILKIDQEPLVLEVGQTAALQVKAVDQEGNLLADGKQFFTILRQEGFVPSSGALVDSVGNVTGMVPGSYNLIVIRPGEEGEAFAKKYVQLRVINKKIAKLELEDFPTKIYSGTSFKLNLKATDEMGLSAPSENVQLKSSNPKVARIDALGHLYAGEPGNASLIMNAGDITSTVQFKVLKNPVESLTLQLSTTSARTGDVVSLNATAFDKSGKTVDDITVLFTVSGVVAEDGSGASAIVLPDGRFVAEKPGTYTILASAGNNSSTATVEITPRNVKREIELVGQGRISNKH